MPLPFQAMRCNPAHSIAWCGRVARLLEEYKQGVLGKTIGSTPELITGIESEAVEGERIAAAFPPGRHREAALRVVARLDLITVDLTNQILQANRPD